MAEHRAKSLFALLPVALATGYLETEPELEPLKVPWLTYLMSEGQSDDILRTLTPTLYWRATIPRQDLPSPRENQFHQLILICISVLY